MSTERCCDLGVVEQGTASFRARFWNALTGELESPSVVAVTVKDPAGTETTFTSPHILITEESEGVFRFDYTVPFSDSSEGRWYIRFRGTAGFIVQGNATFVVPADAMA